MRITAVVSIFPIFRDVEGVYYDNSYNVVFARRGDVPTHITHITNIMKIIIHILIKRMKMITKMASTLIDDK